MHDCPDCVRILCVNLMKSDMQINDFLRQEGQHDVAYTSPSVYVVHYRSEGILCASEPDPSIDAPGHGYDNDNDLGDI